MTDQISPQEIYEIRLFIAGHTPKHELIERTLEEIKRLLETSFEKVEEIRYRVVQGEAIRVSRGEFEDSKEKTDAKIDKVEEKLIARISKGEEKTAALYKEKYLFAGGLAAFLFLLKLVFKL